MLHIKVYLQENMTDLLGCKMAMLDYTMDLSVNKDLLENMKVLYIQDLQAIKDII